LLAKERQRLPIDVPQAAQATLGGVVATNFNGPRRYGQGSVRDYVIGIHAVDGRGMMFKGGGRVVKNVAGYDFCKLLTGSLGTIGVVTHLTMKLKPIPERVAMMVCPTDDGLATEKVLAGLVHSRTTPVAIELMAGKSWAADPALGQFSTTSHRFPMFVGVVLEGTDAEVRWMTQQLGREWWDAGVAAQQTLFDGDAESLLQRWIEFTAAEKSPLVLKASVVSSRVTSFIAAVQQVDPDCSVLSHAANGIVLVRMSQVPVGGATKGVIGSLQTAAAEAQGNVVVLSGFGIPDPTHRSVWGPPSSPQALLTAVKKAFDPKNILNPDRFVYAGY
jgi:glycolate oxidase FAD binding subunit